LRREIGETTGIAHALHGIGEIERNAGDHAEAAAAFEQVIAYLQGEEVHKAWQLAAVRHSLADVRRRQGRDLEARLLVAEALTALRDLGDDRALAECALLVAALALADGQDPESAVRLLAATEALIETSGLAPEDPAQLGRCIAEARAVVPRTRFEELSAEARSLTASDVTALALAVVGNGR
jgi:tetratricopeptide (TPR) repeat protein